jgi:hypothetical protein
MSLDLDFRSRVKHHLFGQADAGWSGISLDIYFGDTISHRKKALSQKGKVPFIIDKKIVTRSSKQKKLKKGDEIDIHIPIRKKDEFLKIHLSDQEKELLNESEIGRIYFRNGVDITEPKHAKYEFRVYYITGLSSLYLEFIEKKWRENGLPKLCSYSSGR